MTMFAYVHLSERVLDINNYLYHCLNGMAGQSWLFDHVMGLGISNNLTKAAVIGACFMLAWLSSGEATVVAARRKILLITLFSSVFVIATTKTISKNVFLPRPYVLSAKTYHLDGTQLVEDRPLEYNVPFDDDAQKSVKDLNDGRIIGNDLESFPSDHAGFFLCLAVGILLAYRAVGIVAILWTVFVPLAAKMIMGQHSPLDVVVGGAIGIAILLVMQFLMGRFANRLLDPVVRWTTLHTALSTALLFIVLFEASNTLDNIHTVAKTGKEVAKHLIGRE